MGPAFMDDHVQNSMWDKEIQEESEKIPEAALLNVALSMTLICSAASSPHLVNTGFFSNAENLMSQLSEVVQVPRTSLHCAF